VKSRVVSVLGLLCAAGAVALACFAAPASAVISHNDPTPLEFPVGGGCQDIQDITVLEPEGLVYVSCGLQTTQAYQFEVRRFHLDGTPAPFTASAPYIAGNSIIADPGSETGGLGDNNVLIAVDSSPSVNHGRLFVISKPDISVFNESGAFAFTVFQPLEGCCVGNTNEGVEVGPDGSIYITSEAPGGRVSKYTPQLQEVKRLYSFTPGSIFVGYKNYLRVDSTGGLWMRKTDLRRFEADQFTTELIPNINKPVNQRLFEAKLSPFVTPNPFMTGAELGDGAIDVDLDTDELYVNRENRIEMFSKGNAQVPTYRTAPPFGAGFLSDSGPVAVTRDNFVFAPTEDEKIVRFGPGDVLADVQSFAADINEIGHKGATLHGYVGLDAADGGTNVKDCKLEVGLSAGSYPIKYPCSPDATVTNYTSDTAVSTNTGETLESGVSFHYRFMAENAKGKNFSGDRTFTPAFVLKLLTLPATAIDADGAVLQTSFDPDGKATEYRFQYGPTTSYGLETPFEPGGSGTGVVTKSSTLSGLPSGKTFHYRVVAKNADGTTIGSDRTFRTASTPDVFSARAKEVTEDSAVLEARIDPVGFETKYRFEYGPTPEYGQVVPAAMTSIGSGSEPVTVSQKITNLTPGITYHFQVVAENEWGTNASDDTTFDFSPPNCPNDHVRQQTGASFLPDCRAYELVSPGTAGAALLLPSIIPASSLGSNNTVYGQDMQIVQNQGFASSPSRFTFWTAVSSLPETNAAVGLKDMDMATRTNEGWVTKVPGLKGNEAWDTGRKMCSESMALCLDHSTSSIFGFKAEGAPYIFTADGQFRGRLPTNLNAITASEPDAARFVGGQAISGDLSHYVFSTHEYVFAPGGVLGGVGSAYYNDIANRTVKVISRLPNGDPIPAAISFPAFGRQRRMDFLDVSPTGSHVLIETPAEVVSEEQMPPPPSRRFRKFLLMWANGISYDISKGYPVEPIGMTRNGDKVLFLADAQMPGTGDTDTSTDLYMWEEANDELVLLSEGNGNGNTDSCVVTTWESEKCSVRPLTPQRVHPRSNLLTSSPGFDDLFAEDSGDVFFYSPEVLDPARPGIKNAKNLYMVRNGVVQLVETLDTGTAIKRIQVSPDGSHAAFLTDSRLTPFDTQGLDEVYTYNADTGVIRCASCKPDGTPPASDATVSQGGRFMADDGRTFFATRDSLVSRDQNGTLIDVYEYVDGRPQLISSGLANNDTTGKEVLNLFLQGADIGLEAVSRDGRDVYFSTFATHVGSDLNGEYMKFYDARSGGGFPETIKPAPCAAADECHGSDSAPPTPPVVATDSALGQGGNVVTPKSASKKKAKGKKERRKKAKRNRKHRRAHTGRGNG
jgi:hypothetical protein